MQRYIPDFLLLFAAVIWGSGFVAADIALESWPPIFITALRFSIATLLFLPFVAKNIKNVVAEIWPGFLIGLFLGLAFIFQTIGLAYTTPSKNAFLTATNVVITPFIYFLFGRKRVKPKNLLGALVSLLGIGILSFDGESFAISNLGDGLTLVCALLFACHIYTTGHFLKEKSRNLHAIVFLQFGISAIISWIGAIFLEDFSAQTVLQAVSSPAGYAVVYLGIFPTLLCFFLQNFAQQKVNQNKTAIILSTEALFGTLLSVLLRGEVLTLSMGIGFVVLFSAILLVEVKNPLEKTG